MLFRSRANSLTKTYGDVLTLNGVEFTSTGLKNGDSISTVTLASAGTTASAVVNSYEITIDAATGSHFSSDNYQISYVPGTLTVTKRQLAVTASSHALTYGDPTPTITSNYSGFVNDDTSEVVSNMDCSTTYTPTSSAGTSQTTNCLGATANNYSFVYTPGSVSIAKRQVTVTASNASLTYGDAVPTVTPSYSGMVNSDSPSVVTGMSCSTIYGQSAVSSNVGSYPTSCSGGSATNYNFVYTGGLVTVAKKELTVTATTENVTYGSAIPAIEAMYSGWVTFDGGITHENKNALNAGSTFADAYCTTVYTPRSDAGTQPGTFCTGGSATNYSFKYVNGVVNIAPRQITITGTTVAPRVYDGTSTVNADQVTVTGMSGCVNLYIDCVAVGFASGTYNFPTVANATNATIS